jgi:hypothetical protein
LPQKNLEEKILYKKTGKKSSKKQEKKPSEKDSDKSKEDSGDLLTLVINCGLGAVLRL